MMFRMLKGDSPHFMHGLLERLTARHELNAAADHDRFAGLHASLANHEFHLRPDPLAPHMFALGDPHFDDGDNFFI
jgi:hypothetical protein